MTASSSDSSTPPPKLSPSITSNDDEREFADDGPEIKEWDASKMRAVDLAFSVGALFLVMLAIWVGWAYLFHKSSPDGAVATAPDVSPEEHVLKAAQLELLPLGAHEISVDEPVDRAGRLYVLEFKCPADRVESWLAASPGTRDRTPQLAADGWKRYALVPADGSMFAEVSVSPAGDQVRVQARFPFR